MNVTSRIPFLVVAHVANICLDHRAACGASDELRELLRSSPQGVNHVVTWWAQFKELRRIFRSSHPSIERCVAPVIESQGRDVLALRHLREEVRALHAAVASQEPESPIPEQRYVFACISDFLVTIPLEGPLEDISILMESFDNFSLAFFAMNQFPNARDRFDWIEAYRRVAPDQIAQLPNFQADFLTEGTSALRKIRTSLTAPPPSIGYCHQSHHVYLHIEMPKCLLRRSWRVILQCSIDHPGRSPAHDLKGFAQMAGFHRFCFVHHL